MMPGETALTRMPRSAYSMASERVAAARPPWASALATTAQSRLRYPATRPAPTPREAPVMMATLWVVMVNLLTGDSGRTIDLPID